MKQNNRLYLVLFLLALGCWDLSLSERPQDSSNGSDDDSAPATASEDSGSEQDTQTDSDSSTTPSHPCEGMVCDTPPSDSICEDAANKIRRHASSGYCEVEDGEPVCRYPTFVDTCLLGDCIDGHCPRILAQNKSCQPKDPVCDGKELITTDISSATMNGNTPECVYIEQRTTCDEGCGNDRCVDAPCLGISCHRPPARYCHEENLITFSPVGNCDDSGICRYKKKLTACSEGCSEGACNESNACRFLTCRTPPASFCLDDQRLLRYDNRGFCADGACIYSGETIECPCSDGICQDDPCLGIQCLHPPPMQCNQKGNLLAWTDDGDPLCKDGECIYKQQEFSCGEEHCTDGECSDPCIGMDAYCNDLPLPPEFCIENSVISYDTATQCDADGHCLWTEKDKACTDCDTEICETD